MSIFHKPTYFTLSSSASERRRFRMWRRRRRTADLLWMLRWLLLLGVVLGSVPWLSEAGAAFTINPIAFTTSSD
jgi:hypothetical protein